MKVLLVEDCDNDALVTTDMLVESGIGRADVMRTCTVDVSGFFISRTSMSLLSISNCRTAAARILFQS